MKRMVPILFACTITTMPINALTTVKEIDASDHNYLSMKIENDMKIAQLNTAQFGVLKIFVNKDENNDKNFPYVLSPVFRRPSYLKILHDKREKIAMHILRPLVELAFSSRGWLSMAERNEKMERLSREMMPKLEKIGFPVTDVKMSPIRAFNPDADEEMLWKYPANYVAGPSFWYEDNQTHSARIRSAYETLFENQPSLATAQEVQFGASFGIDFSELHENIMANHGRYSAIKGIDTSTPSYRTCSVIYYDNTTMEDVSDEHGDTLGKLRKDFYIHFGMKADRVVVSALRQLYTGVVYTVASIHAIYEKANEREAYRWLSEYLKNNENVVIAGDFNLKASNAEFKDQINDRCHALWALTPEPATVGNPTFDAIIINTKN